MSHRALICSVVCLLTLSLSGCSGSRPAKPQGVSAGELDAVRARAAEALRGVEAEVKSGATEPE